MNLTHGVSPVCELIALVCSPEGPSTPFDGPVLAVFDMLRVLTVAAVLYVAGRARSDLARMVSPGQRARHLGICFLGAGVIITQLDHLGDLLSPRLILFLIGMTLLCYGVRELRTREEPARQQRRGRHEGR